jgi:adenosylcobinamide-phosphate synthase
MNEAAAIILFGALIDCAIGWPDALYRRIGHPVTWLGRVIGALEPLWNKGSRTRRILSGGLLVALCVACAALPAWAIMAVLPPGFRTILVGSLLAWPLIAIRSMHSHVDDVAHPLSAGDLKAARAAVAMIVGRDPNRLDSAGVARAAIESLGENSSDGIVAPVFWGVVAGLPGLAAYKAINTLDSMIAYRSERYEAFGKIAARLDDAVNWVPARLTGLLFALVAGRGGADAMRAMARDARAHRSPNAGWPEAALAGALGIRLSGPRAYGTHSVDEPWLNAGAPDPTPEDLQRALALYRRAMALMMLALCVLALV